MTLGGGGGLGSVGKVLLDALASLLGCVVN